MLQIARGGLSQIRQSNKFKILHELFISHEISRTDLKDRLNISASTITRVVEELMRDGLIVEVTTQDTLVGRKPTLLAINKCNLFTVGLHVRNDSIRLCILSISGDVVFSSKTDMSHIETASEFIAQICTSIDEAVEMSRIETEQILSVGIACRGAIDSENEIIVRYREGIANIEIGKILREKYDSHVYLENNLFFSVEYEYVQKTGDHSLNLFYLYADEGVGACAIDGGQMVKGAKHMTGKIGHMLVEEGGRACSCGKLGHLEAYAAPKSIEKIYHEKTGENKSLVELCAMAEEGDFQAVEILSYCLGKIARAITQCICILNPERIVLQGALFSKYSKSLMFLNEAVKEAVFLPEMGTIDWSVRDINNEHMEFDIARYSTSKYFEISQEFSK